MRHRGDLHRGLEPGPSSAAALRVPGRATPYPYRFGSAGLLFSARLRSAAGVAAAGQPEKRVYRASWFCSFRHQISIVWLGFQGPGTGLVCARDQSV